jgi:hypothetical protein
MQQRIYKVTSGDETHLVMAGSQAQALRHVAGSVYKVSIAKATEVASLMGSGVVLEKSDEKEAAE